MTNNLKQRLAELENLYSEGGIDGSPVMALATAQSALLEECAKVLKQEGFDSTMYGKGPVDDLFNKLKEAGYGDE